MAPLTRLILPLVLIPWISTSFAEEGPLRYIVENHPVELRSGFTEQDHGLATLNPGEKVTLLKSDSEEGQARVQRDNGMTGWVLTDDLTETAPNKLLPAPLTEASPTKNPDQLQQELGRLQRELIESRTASADILRIQAERDQLQSNVITLKREVEALRQEKSALSEDQKQTWFVIGGLVVFGGIVLGLILPRLSTRRRNPWGSL
jgi:SH3 domain protein